MMSQRARWSSKYEKALVDVLTEYRLSHFRGQNGWCTEGWNRIVKDFNSLCPDAKFTKAQIQDKESQLKKDYKAVKSIRTRSGVSWNQTASMINTTSEIWDEIIEEDSKLRRYENKSFPLFDALDLLYEGQFAEGKHCFTSSKPHKAGSKRSGGTEKTLLDFTKKRPWDAAINVGAHDGEESIYPIRMDDFGKQNLESESLQSQG
ncbi:uncharacterized protein LOC133925966 [Phragmites australis]|uniref:uncharacterized protein LOC133925966 n=1 Tax=Phragmites australis TaxID=29695 RepID=UPI002D7A38DD|nr:uncharacterized protein LOC133925966 [Phragmites australis]